MDMGVMQVLKSWILAAVFIIATIVYPSFGSAGGADVAARIDSLVGEVMKTAQVPGMSVLVAKDERIILSKGYGLADVEHAIPVTPDTVFAIGSLTKQFTGLAVAQLVAEKKISLDDSLQKYIPEYPEYGNKITIRNLLNHTSGLFNYTQNPELHRQADENHSHQEMMAWFKDIPPAFSPGERFSYTNSGIYLLGMIIERVTGMAYADYLRRHVFEPFGMEHTYYGDSFTIISNRARGYDLSKKELKNAMDYSATVPFTAGALLSTPRDLLFYVRQVHEGRLVSKKVRDVIYKREKFPDGSPIDYALGCIKISDFKGHRKYSHAGEIYGYFSQLAYYPADRLTVVILSNRKSYMPSPVSLEAKIARVVLGLPERNNETRKIDFDAAELTGIYDFGRLSFFSEGEAVLWFDGEMLMLSFGKEIKKEGGWPFRYTGDGRFVLLADDEVWIENKGGARLHTFDTDIEMKKIQGIKGPAE